MWPGADFQPPGKALHMIDACFCKTEPCFLFLPVVCAARRSGREGITQCEIRQPEARKWAAACRKLESKGQVLEAPGSWLGLATSVQRK